MTHRTPHTRWILWPVVALWKLISWIVELTGRLLAVVVGAVLLLAGVLISLTIVGAVLGVPLAILGLLIVLRGLF